MKNIAIEDVRNFAVVGHTGSGKTTLIDNILHKIGLNDRIGSVDDGTSMCDWTDEEKERKITISAKPFSGIYSGSGGKKTELVIIDTPGYMDFVGQVIAATSVADAAVVVIDANSGIQVGTNRSWKYCESHNLPRAIVINGIDKENADFAGVVQSIKDVWGANRCVPVVIPSSSGVVDILATSEFPDDVADQASELKGSLVESAAETDDALIEKYLGGENLTADEIAKGLHGAVHDGNLIPIFAVSATGDVGVAELLDGIARLFPSPIELPVKDTDGNDIGLSPSDPAVGLVWRSVNDPYVGQLTFMRVYGGTVTPDSELFNVTQGQKEKVGTLYAINGKKQENLKAAIAGDIVAFAKMKTTTINDTLCAPGTKAQLPTIGFPHPVVSYAITPKTQGDEDKMATGLQKVSADDPTLTVDRNTATHEMIISGMGDVHIEIAVHQMKAKNNVEVELHTPKVPYKETVMGQGEGHYKHKKQSGGRGQYGEVYLRIGPKDPTDEEWFENKIVGGAIPSNFIPAVQKGLVEGMETGAIAGYPVTNVKVAVYDGSYHDVDSSEIAFKIAASRAFREGMGQAKPVLLEPIMKVKVMVPDQFMGDVNGDLNQKRGRILGMGVEDGIQVIEAEVPQAELFKFSSELRSMTGGRGSFEMEFSRYDQVPANVAQKVVAAASKAKEEED